MTDIKLLELHPVLRRLSGQVVWLMFEEAQAPMERIEAFMDYYEKVKSDTANVIYESLKAEKPSRWVHITIDKQQNHGCTQCNTCADTILATDNPDFLQLLPPYGLGCLARAKCLDHLPADMIHHARLTEKSTLPVQKLICGDWIFRFPWEKK